MPKRAWRCRRRRNRRVVADGEIDATLLLDRSAEDRAMGNIQQSIIRLDPNACISAPLRTGRATDGRVLARHDRISPIEFLAARYPVIRRLVGELSFRVVARRFILREPPGAPIPHGYGDNFPRFLRTLGNTASIEYVADIAELEMLRQRAQYAAHARPLAAPALSSLRAERLNGSRVVLHPSVCLVQSRFPIVTIWENNQTNDDNGMIERWTAEAAVVTRPFLEVEIRRLPPGGYTFLRALSEGQTVATAVGIATEATPTFEAAPNLALLENANVLVNIQEAA
jgi:Putative DNA-binding domain